MKYISLLAGPVSTLNSLVVSLRNAWHNIRARVEIQEQLNASLASTTLLVAITVNQSQEKSIIITKPIISAIHSFGFRHCHGNRCTAP